MCYLQARDLAFERDAKTIFRSVSFELNPSELLLVQGENGAGKTSLLRFIVGFLTGRGLEECRATIQFGQELNKLRPLASSDFIWLGDKNSLKPNWTALQNLKFLAALRGSFPDSSELLSALARFDLFHSRHDLVKTFSSGMQRRLALASLLVVKKDLWILDEPQLALDKQGRELFDEVLAGHLSLGRGAVVASHHPISWDKVKVLELER